MWHSIYRHMALVVRFLRQGVRSCTRHFLSHRRGLQQLSPLDILILKASEENERKPQRPLNIVGIMRIAKVIKHIPWDLLYDFRQLRIQISAHDLSDMNNVTNLINHESLSISQIFFNRNYNLCRFQNLLFSLPPLDNLSLNLHPKHFFYDWGHVVVLVLRQAATEDDVLLLRN